jgi:hypothetical protein
VLEPVVPCINGGLAEVTRRIVACHVFLLNFPCAPDILLKQLPVAAQINLLRELVECNLAFRELRNSAEFLQQMMFDAEV